MENGFRKACKNTAGYIKSDKKTVRAFILSIISLVVAVATIVTMTFSWFTNKTSSLEAGSFVLDCGKGLRVNDSGTSQLSFSTDDNRYLTPASSVDGRNLFFPTDGSDFSSTTEYMTFRSANVGDKNVNFIQIDFTLTAQQDHTALYINDAKTSIRVAENNPTHIEDDWSIPRAACLRSALWSSTAEQGVPNTPIVFNPTASTLYTAAVQDVDRSTGSFISSGRQVAHTFSEYAFGGSPVATLSKGVETKFSYIIWLEGTDPKCTDKVMNKDIEIKLAFTTSWDKTQTIRFDDQTAATSNKPEHWVKDKLKNDHYTLSLRYAKLNANDEETGENMDFTMYEFNNDSNNTVWTCNIPGDMRKSITFILRPSSTSTDHTTYIFEYNSKNPGQRLINRGANRLYVAESLYNTTGGAGYWMALGDSDGAGHDSGNLDGDDF